MANLDIYEGQLARANKQQRATCQRETKKRINVTSEEFQFKGALPHFHFGSRFNITSYVEYWSNHDNTLDSLSLLQGCPLSSLLVVIATH